MWHPGKNEMEYYQFRFGCNMNDNIPFQKT